MSVFSQLMMRRFHSAVNYIPLTVVGSPTINNMILSNTTSANYVKFNCGTNTIDVWEMSIDFVFPTNPAQSYNALISRVSSGFQIFNKTSGNGLQIEINGSEQIITFGDLVRGNNYNINIKYNAGSWVAVLTNKDTSATSTKTTTTSNVWFLSGEFRFGLTQSGNYGYDDSINLATSYIKIGTTKYNFQFTIPLTKVGSPTITDGVVSGFSSADYVKTGLSFILQASSNIEFYLRFKIDVATGNKSLLNIGSIWSAPLISVSDNYISGAIIGSMGTTASERLEVDTYYRVKITMNNSVSNGYIYNDNGTLRAEKNNNPLSFADRTGNFLVGATYGTSTPAINSIDLNNSYIIINGTKYIFTIGA